MPLNPWLVENIEAFSFYCCPECVFRSKEENFFQAHALQNHPNSKLFFLENDVDVKKENFEKENFEKENTPDLLKIKEEVDVTEDLKHDFRCIAFKHFFA